MNEPRKLTVEEKKAQGRVAPTGIRYIVSRDRFQVEFQGRRSTFETVEEAEEELRRLKAEAKGLRVPSGSKPVEQPAAPRKAFKGRVADLAAKLAHMAANPHPAEALIQLCARIADEQSEVRDVIPFDDFRRLVEAADPELFRKLPSDFNVGRVMQSAEIEAQYGFWEVRKRDGLQPIIVFTEQREPVFDGVPDFLIDADKHPHPGSGDDGETLCRDVLAQRQLTLGANMASRLGAVHERMSLWDFRELCLAEDPELFRLLPTGFGKLMTNADNQEWYGTWRTEKCREPRANGDVAPWIIFIPR